MERDSDGNALGRYRLPVMDVPVATYDGSACITSGLMVRFTDDKVRNRYRTPAQYLASMQAFVDQAVDAHHLLAEDGAELMGLAESSARVLF